jgi:nucleoside recognition membrane protein YjiH
MSNSASEMKTNSNGSIAKFIIFSIIGIVLFFIPVIDGQVPVVFIVNILRSALGVVLDYIVFISCILLLISLILSKFTSNPKIKERHKSDGIITTILYILAVVFIGMVLFNIGPAPIIDPNVGGLALSLAGSVIITVTIAGWLVIFIVKSGLVEFIGVLLEPFMRPLFKLPGEAAVNIMASFVSAPAVAVYITNDFYNEGIYTEKEGVHVIANFSICSIGFFGVLVSIGGIIELYPQVVLTSFVVLFILGVILARIPPVSMRKNIYPNGELQTKELLLARRASVEGSSRLKRALDLAADRSKEITIKSFFDNLIDAVKFGQEIISFVIPVATIALVLAEYTQIFVYLGKPMIPYLNLLGIENAVEIAPSTLIGITEMALPIMIIAGQNIAVSSLFFIVVLSAVQIIFFAESVPAMLRTNVPVRVVELVILFILRTMFAIPIIALITKLIF